MHGSKNSKAPGGCKFCPMARFSHLKQRSLKNEACEISKECEFFFFWFGMT